ncbi:DUF4907 domain-containing protein [Crocinitomix algicola]|uniref:DUF4907 domain-containing protein n=1 Tax=Crocinitomix algicola TaxID=1740263 RepID=UPI0008730EE3|nr:DUF4907 domain-containing protein [Crocinitomix algicola]
MESNYNMETFENDDQSWGYNILRENQLFIHQPHIPAISGKNGFKSEKEANIVGHFVLTKINKGFIPPTITINELDSLGVLKDLSEY